LPRAPSLPGLGLAERWWPYTAPASTPSEWIEVCGPTGYRGSGTTYTWFLCLARLRTYGSGASATWHWIDVDGDALSDRGWEPTHWRMPRPFPDTTEVE
jgi:hypothetical protein